MMFHKILLAGLMAPYLFLSNYAVNFSLYKRIYHNARYADTFDALSTNRTASVKYEFNDYKIVNAGHYH